jgi:Tol biopolymer transport system component
MPGGPAAIPAVARTAARPARRMAAALLAAAAVGAAVMLWLGLSRATRPRAVRVAPLTSFPGDEVDPAVSPDGTRVAYAWNGGDGRDFDIWVRLVNDATPLRITEGAASDKTPAWSPDGSRLAFARYDASGCGIFLVSALGGAPRRLADCGDPYEPEMDWSPDGRSIAISAREGERPARIRLLAADGSAGRTVTDPPPGTYGDWSPAFSPDGRRIAFVRTIDSGVEDLWIAGADGAAPRRMTFDNLGITGVSWSRDGRSVVFSSNRAGPYSLWKLPASGGSPEWITGGGSKFKDPSTARARDLVAWENWIYEVNLWREPAGTPADEGAAAVIAASADEWNFDPAFSPDGSRVAFVSTRSGSYEIWTSAADGTDAHAVTSFGGVRVGRPSWSPDGATIVFTARPDGPSDLYTVDAAGGPPRRLTREPGDEVAPAYSRDGRALYFGSRRSGEWQVWRMPSSGGAAVAVTRAGGYAASESLDGHTLYFSRFDAPGLWSKALPDGPETLVTALLERGDWASWQVTTAGIYFRTYPHSGDAGILRLSPERPQPQRIASLREEAWSGFAVSPDGKWIVYPRVDRRTADIRIIENAL